MHQATRSAKHNGGASTTTLATREVAYQLNYKIVVGLLVFRALHNLAPTYVSTLITPYAIIGSALLCVPRHRLERYGRRSLSCAGPVLWNSLPEDLRLADSLNSLNPTSKHIILNLHITCDFTPFGLYT